MASNVIYLNNIVVDGQTPLIAARLCNFKTGDATLLTDHLAWINTHLKNAIAASPNAWIDIQAYASKTGSASLNQTLSENRRDQVKAHIAAAGTSAKFMQAKALGETASGGDESDNDGYWRAVEVYAFGSLPRVRFPDHHPVRPIHPPKGVSPGPGADIDQWFVTNLSLNGAAIVPGLGGGGFSGPITFEHVGSINEPIFNGFMAIAGGAVGISEGLPGFKDTTIARRAVKFLADNGGFSFANAPSWTAGICFHNPVQVSRLRSAYFAGDCATIFYSGNAYAIGCGFYLLIFGLPVGFWFWPSTYALMSAGLIGPDLGMRCKGVALISTFGTGLSASVGHAANAMVGRIS